MRWRINPALSFTAALDAWRLQAGVGKRPRTVLFHAEICTRILKHWPEHRETPCAALTADDVARFATRIGDWSPDQFNAAVYVLKAVVPEACWLRRRPVRPKVVLLPSREEFARLLVELDKAKRGHAGLIVRLLVLSGLRIGEARALTWADVLPNGLLVRDSKTGQGRVVPWFGECRQVVERLRAVAGKSPHLVNCASIKTALRNACTRAGMAPLSHHDLRKLFATRLIEGGADVPSASRFLGHRDGGALLGKTYFHLLAPHAEQLARRTAIL